MDADVQTVFTDSYWCSTVNYSEYEVFEATVQTVVFESVADDVRSNRDWSSCFSVTVVEINNERADSLAKLRFL